MTKIAELTPALFLERENRFVLRAQLCSGERVKAHLADPGRLEDLLTPHAEMRLLPSSDPRRRTRWSAVLVRASEPPGDWVSLQPSHANRLAEEAIRSGVLTEALGESDAWIASELRREVRQGSHRFDFQLPSSRQSQGPLWIEVKSVSWLQGQTLLFPDAPSLRAARHLDALRERLGCGERALLLWVIQREAGRQLQLAEARDPRLAESFRRAAKAGLETRVLRYRFDPTRAPQRVTAPPFVNTVAQVRLRL